ncbi:MAG: hypothetical protein NTW43_03605 [Actinobacteria bacterium]|nr:hypothetical protein [Actinomycetota bacterium]
MKFFRRFLSLTLTTFLIALAVFVNPSQALADNHSMDVRYLQTCLKQKGASLDVLVLMDSSRSLRNSKPGEKINGPSGIGSDPDDSRGPILLSSLNLLLDLAEDSGNSFRVNLKNFGNNSGEDLKALEAKWVPWTVVKPNKSESVLNDFVARALFDDSKGTDWAKGLATAKVDFSTRISEAERAGTKSCSIMFWITDGVPSKPAVEKAEICKSDGESSIDWFRKQNILVLGGLLIPKEGDSSLFRPIVTGDDCGKKEVSWTKGYVIEANDINSLAWEFVSLVANIRNLVNLDFSDDTVVLDPGTSQMEIYIKGEPSQWEVKAPDGSVFCSSSNFEPTKCEVKTGKTNITTITVTPVDPKTTQGSWKFTSLPSAEVKVYGGISVEPNPVKLVVVPGNRTVNEGDTVKFTATLKNADDTLFDISGFKSVKICATLDSNGVEVCKSGSASAVLELLPSMSDTTVPFTAVITSNNGEDRQYNVSAVVNVLVQESGKFPSLVCGSGSEGDLCVIPDLKNKTSKESVQLKALKPTDAGAVSGQIYIVDIEVTRDDFARNFKFVLTDARGNVVNLGDKTALFNPNDTLNLEVSFDKGEASQIEGVIKYAVVTGDQTVIRQLNFGFDVGDYVPWWKLILLLLGAYLLTIAVPYAFLLWSARRNAFLSVADNEFAYLEEPVTISQSGQVISRASKVENALAGALDPSHEGLKFEAIENGARAISIGNVHIEVIPPKLNPFAEPATHIYVKDNHVLSTYGGAEFLQDRAFFSRSLTGEAIIYFPSEENIAPRSADQIDSFEPVSKTELFASSPTKAQGEELLINSGDIFATALYLVPRYENRRKSLSNVNSKLKSTLESANLGVHIAELRQNALDAEVLRLEELKKEALEQSAKKIDKKEPKGKVKEKSISIVEEELSGNGKSLFSDETDTPDSGSGKKLWD